MKKMEVIGKASLLTEATLAQHYLQFNCAAIVLNLLASNCLLKMRPTLAALPIRQRQID